MIIRGSILSESGTWEVELKSGKVIRMKKIGDNKSNIWITPGLFDIQVNGYKGINLTSKTLKQEDVGIVEKELVKFGITRWCPTVITAHPDVILNSLRTIRKAEESGIAKNIHCIHLEGPYISAEEGYRGVHPVEFIHDQDLFGFNSFQNSAGGRIGYVTIAPERKNAIDFTSYLSKQSI